MLTLDLEPILHSSTAELARTHLEKGKIAFREFLNGLGMEASFYKPIKKNKADFFRQETPVTSSDMKQQVLGTE